MPPHPYRILAPYFFPKEFLMLEQLSVLSPDPILGLAAECRITNQERHGSCYLEDAVERLKELADILLRQQAQNIL